MADFQFYTEVYLGDSIPQADFPRLLGRAEAQLQQYERHYRVKGDPLARDSALCAMADAAHYFEAAVNQAESASIGSVSCRRRAVDAGAKAQEKELYRCAALYLELYRGYR